jgi:uncharacterized protein (TIGR03382 family)
MNTGFGPYGVVSAGEIFGTLVILAVALLALAWMGQRTRRT